MGTIYKDCVVAKVDEEAAVYTLVDEATATVDDGFVNGLVIGEILAPELKERGVKVGDLFNMSLYSCYWE